MKAFYFFLDSETRRAVARGNLDCPGADYMLYGANRLPEHGIEVQHNLEANSPPPSRWHSRFAWLADRLIRLIGGSSGDFQTVLKERRRFREADIVVSTVDNVGVPLVWLNTLGMLRRPLLYVSIGLPERIASIKSPLTRALYRRLYRSVPRFATYGWEEAVRLREWLELPPDSDRVTFIPFGVDQQAFQPRPDVIPDTDVLSVGADMQRDFKTLLLVARELPSVSFRIITSSRHVATFGPVPANVEVRTNVPFAEIGAALAKARIIALPCHENTYSSGTTTLLQAMAMAKPVVVSRNGAIRNGYHLEDNVNCRLITPGSAKELSAALGKLLGDSSSQTRLGAAARQTIESHLTWTHYVTRYAQLIRSFPLP